MRQRFADGRARGGTQDRQHGAGHGLHVGRHGGYAPPYPQPRRVGTRPPCGSPVCLQEGGRQGRAPSGPGCASQRTADQRQQQHHEADGIEQPPRALGGKAMVSEHPADERRRHEHSTNADRGERNHDSTPCIRSRTLTRARARSGWWPVRRYVLQAAAHALYSAIAAFDPSNTDFGTGAEMALRAR